MPGRVRQSRARRKPDNGQKEKEKQEKEQEALQKSKSKFENHQKETQSSIQRILQELSDSSDEEETQESIDRLEHIKKSIRGDYSGDETAYERATQNIQSACVICLEKVRTKDSIWQCEQCFCLLHLPCTQSWARNCYCEETEGNDDENGYWACPKCRMLYPRRNIPRSYRCYCGKVENPPVDYWIAPHSVS